MRTCKESCTFGPEYDQCCVKRERYPEYPRMCDFLDEYKKCPSYVEGEDDGRFKTMS